MVVLPDGSRAPSGGRLRQGCPSLPDIPADANGGLCIGRSFADALGAWGPLTPNKLRRVYTGALLATTISTYIRGLKVACGGGILDSHLFGKLRYMRYIGVSL